MEKLGIWKTKTFWVAIFGIIGAAGSLLAGKIEISSFISTVIGFSGMITIRHNLK